MKDKMTPHQEYVAFLAAIVYEFVAGQHKSRVRESVDLAEAIIAEVCSR